MGEIIRDESNNSITFKMEDPAAFSAFRMSQANNDMRQLNRTEESRALRDMINDHSRQSRVVVQYGDTFSTLKR